LSADRVDPAVLRGMARWPDVPAVYGWLALDRRGNWRLKEAASGRFGRIGNAALRDFIGRNYASDGAGQWFFQNGPQRVYVSLAYTPLVVHYEQQALRDHCGREARADAMFVDEEGSVLILGERDLAQFVARRGEDWESLPRVAKSEVPGRFGFVAAPSDSLR
jgi:hypothetical protein